MGRACMAIPLRLQHWSSQELLRSSQDSRSKYRAGQRFIYPLERIHYRFDPYFIHFRKEQS